MKAFRLSFILLASLFMGFFAGTKHFIEQHPSAPVGDR